MSAAKSNEARIARTIGPRRVGGVYRSGYWGTTYEVLEIRTEGLPLWKGGVEIVERDLDGQFAGRIRRHCTPWDKRDQIISEPQS